MKLLLFVFIYSAICYSRIVLTEIMFNSPGSDHHDEYVEIYNDSDEPVDLTGWQVGDQDRVDTMIIYEGFDHMILQPKRYCIIMDPSYITSSTTYEGVIPDSVLRVTINSGSFGSYGFSNTVPETVRLYNSEGILVDSYTYTIDQPKGYSDERVFFDKDIWENSLIFGGTPGFKNSVVPPDFDIMLIDASSPDIINNEGQNEFTLTVTNRGLNTIERFIVNSYINGEFVRDDEYLFSIEYGDSADVKVQLEFEAEGSVSVMFTAEAEYDDVPDNNSVSVTVFVPYRLSPLVINEFMKRPDTGQCEFVEIYNISDSPVNLGDFGISDEVKTRVVFFPDSIIQPDTYVVMAKNANIYNFDGLIHENVYVASGLAILNVGTDAVFLLYKDMAVADSISYFGFDNDLGKSIEKISPELNSAVLSNWTLSKETGGTPTLKNSSVPLDNDLSLVSVSAPERIIAEDFNSFQLTVFNSGYETVEGFTVHAFVNEFSENSYHYDHVINYRDSVQFTHQVFLDKPGTVEVRFEVEIAADSDLSNNTGSVQVFVPFIRPSLVLNEFMKRPSSTQCEYVEIYNISDETLELSDFGISDEVKSRVVFFPRAEILPGGYAVMAKNENIFNFADVDASKIFIASGLATLNAGRDDIYLLTRDGSAVDSIAYSDLDDDSGRSIEKINPEFPSYNLNNWAYCTGSGTPTKTNSVFQKPGSFGNEARFGISPRTATPNGDGYNDNLIISYEFDSAYVFITVKIYNIKGQLIARPLNGHYSSSQGYFVWNCRDNNGITVNTGAYICFLTAKDDKGRIYEFKEPFYIAK